MNAFRPTLAPQIRIADTARVYAIGDIHGYPTHLRGILHEVQKDLTAHLLSPGQDYQLVFLGDYIDRGPDAKGVLDILTGLHRENPAHIFLQGNHEQDFADVLKWLSGDTTVPRHRAEQTAIAYPQTYKSYGVESGYGLNWELPDIKRLLDAVPNEHKVFLQDLPRSAVMGQYLFVHDPFHAIGDPERWTSGAHTSAKAYIWKHRNELPPDHPARNQIIVHGHCTKIWGAPPEEHAHRIGLNDYSDDHSHRITGAVLETGRRPRFISYTGSLKCDF